MPVAATTADAFVVVVVFDVVQSILLTFPFFVCLYIFLCFFIFLSLSLSSFYLSPNHTDNQSVSQLTTKKVLTNHLLNVFLFVSPLPVLADDAAAQQMIFQQDSRPHIPSISLV